jgi:hypothetical protein
LLRIEEGPVLDEPDAERKKKRAHGSGTPRERIFVKSIAAAQGINRTELSYIAIDIVGAGRDARTLWYALPIDADAVAHHSITVDRRVLEVRMVAKWDDILIIDQRVSPITLVAHNALDTIRLIRA